MPPSLAPDHLKQVLAHVEGVDLQKAAKRSTIAPRFQQLTDAMEQHKVRASRPLPGASQEARDLVWANVPSFVYYANYGNLDSEIYLPHVIANLKRKDLGNREEAKVRTLRVLFEFVRLSPEEILELGEDVTAEKGEEPTEEEIARVAEQKKEREILLQSASADLTTKFRDWWKQGDYKFRFHADGDHFRIWVADDRRPEEIELESRSSGLQWFLSFYLVFLVESAEAHKGAILLLDEPGHSLHPLAQEDLSAFFDSLSKTNQLIYTTHSPFLVDADHLDRVKAVYVDESGLTAVSPDLRAAEGQAAQTQSIYAVDAALGLRVSKTFLRGCQPVIVEGQADQTYLSAIKTYLIREGLIHPRRELVFLPAGGVRGVSAVVSIITGNEALPHVLLDSDPPGENLAKQLRSGLYKAAPERVLMAGDLLEMAGAEVEDLLPVDLMKTVVSGRAVWPWFGRSACGRSGSAGWGCGRGWVAAAD